MQLGNIKEKVSQLAQNKTARNGVIFSFFSFLNNGVNFLLLIIIANYIAPEGYGKLNLFTTSVTLLSYFICLNSTGIISVNFFRMDAKRVRQTINAVFMLTLGGLLFFMTVAALFSSQIAKAVDFGFEYQWMVVCCCFFQVFTSVNLDIWRLEEKPLLYGLYSLSLVVLNFGLTLLFLISLLLDWEGRIYAQILCGAVFFLISVVILIKRGYMTRILPTRQTFRDVLSFSIPLIPHNISFWIRQGLDRYIINLSYGAALVGNFSFAYNFANIIQIVGTAFNATNSVFIYKNLSENPEKAVKKLRTQTIYISLFFVGLTAAICLGAHLLLPIIFPKYTGALPFIIPLCIGALFHCLYLQFVNFLFFYKKTKILALITFSISILQAISSIILTQYSVFYTVYISMTSNILIAIGVFLYSRKFFKIF